MAEVMCSTCRRYSNSLNSDDDSTQAWEVSLAAFDHSDLNCASCEFVATLLKKDETTPKTATKAYETAKIRVDNGGRRFTGQWHGALVIELYQRGEEPKLPTPHEIPPEITCDLAARIIKDWLKSCQDHTECNEDNFFSLIERQRQREAKSNDNVVGRNSASIILPGRLISLVGSATTGHLVSCEAGASIKYAALSYCWGGNGTFKTEEHTLQNFEQGFPLEKLPTTIRDACELTKKIGLDYLWVDAICIVQGNQEDWELESQKMGHIYANATIVLSAARSANADQGIFSPRSRVKLSNDIKAPDGLIFARRSHNHEIITSCRTKSNKWWETYINTTFPLLSRGWGFQERMLSTRIVHFTPTELVWECQKTRKCECRIVESDLFPVMNNMSSALRICLKQPLDERSMRQMWREVVNSYSVRKLTRIEDKLPALSGIARLLNAKSGDIYAAGLWRRSLPFDLLWRCDQSGDLKARKDRSPSWSWISVDGAIKWPVSQHSNNDQPLKYINSTTYFECGADGVEILDVRCDLDGEDELGRVKSASIKLKTRLAPTTILFVPDYDWTVMYGTEWAIQVGDSHQSPFWPDLCKDGLQPQESDGFRIMEIMNPRDIPGSWEEGIVVRLTKGSWWKSLVQRVCLSLCRGQLRLTWLGSGRILQWNILPYMSFLPLQEFVRVGVAANVSSSSSSIEWTTSKSWFGSVSVDTVMLV